MQTWKYTIRHIPYAVFELFRKWHDEYCYETTAERTRLPHRSSSADGKHCYTPLGKLF